MSDDGGSERVPDNRYLFVLLCHTNNLKMWYKRVAACGVCWRCFASQRMCTLLSIRDFVLVQTRIEIVSMQASITNHSRF